MHTVIPSTTLITRDYLFKSSLLDMELQTPNYKIKFESQRHFRKFGAHQEMKSKE